MKKILLVSPFFHPEPISTGKYNSYLASGLVQKNVDVSVLCSHPLYPSWRVSKTNEGIPGCTIIRGGSWLRYPRHPVARRLLLEAWFTLFVFRHYALLRQQDAIVPVFPPSLAGASLLCLRPSQCKVIAVVHDLQGIHAASNRGRTGQWLRCVIHSVEGWVFRRCDHLVFLSSRMKMAATDTYGISDQRCSVHYPFVTIRTWINRGNLSRQLPDGQLSIVYAGALGQKQAPDKIVALFLYLLERHPLLHAHFFSEGPEFEKIHSSITHERLHFHPLVAEEDLAELLLRSTIQLLPQETGTTDGSLPSKLPNLLASGVKILCITDETSELCSILEPFSQVRIATNWEPENIARLTDTLLAVDTSGQAPLSNTELLAPFRLDELVDRIVSLVEGATVHPR